MKPIEFPEQNCVYAKDQPEYLPLPVHKTEDGMVVSCWRLTWRERLRVLLTGKCGGACSRSTTRSSRNCRAWIGHSPIPPTPVPPTPTPSSFTNFVTQPKDMLGYGFISYGQRFIGWDIDSDGIKSIGSTHKL